MTKQEEIEKLTRFTKRLPEDSYIRPMLEELLPYIADQIRQDFMPDPIAARDKAFTDLLQFKQEIKDLQLAYNAIKNKADETERTITRNRNEIARTIETAADLRAKLAHIMNTTQKQ